MDVRQLVEVLITSEFGNVEEDIKHIGLETFPVVVDDVEVGLTEDQVLYHTDVDVARIL